MDGGCLNIRFVNIGVFGIVSIMYAMSSVFNGKPLDQSLLSIFPFVILILINALPVSNFIADLITFFIIGILIYIYGSIDNLIGVIFVLSSFDKNKPTPVKLMALFLVFIIALALKSNIQNMTQIQVLVSILGSIYVGIFYFIKLKPKTIIIEQKKEKIKKIDVIKISQEEKAIIKLYCRGYDYEKISKTLCLNVLPSTVRRKIKSIKDRYHDDITGTKDKSVHINDAQFGIWLYSSV